MTPWLLSLLRPNVKRAKAPGPMTFYQTTLHLGFLAAGCRVTSLPIAISNMSLAHMQALLSEADVVLVSGGNTLFADAPPDFAVVSNFRNRKDVLLVAFETADDNGDQSSV